jgi:hypothetical protein
LKWIFQRVFPRLTDIFNVLCSFFFQNRSFKSIALNLLNLDTMKRSIILSFIMVFLAITTSYAVNQSDEKETRDLSGFTKVNFGVAGNLYINIGPEFKVVLEGDRSLLNEIITEVRAGKLIIRKDNWRLRMNDRVTVYITMPEIDGLGVSGSGKAEIKDAVKTGDLDLNVSGSGKIYTSDLAVDRLDCGISGSGNIELAGNGSIARGDISISGSGNYASENISMRAADISISGSGNCTCNVTESLRASVSGSGNVTYLGNPRVDARVSGSGKVRSR